MRRKRAVFWFVVLMLFGCGGAKYFRASVPETVNAFACSVSVLDSLGYTLYHLDDQRREARAEVREGSGFSYASRDIIWVSVPSIEGADDSLHVTAAFADARPAGANGTDRISASGAPSARTREDAAHVVHACGRAP